MTADTYTHPDPAAQAQTAPPESLVPLFENYWGTDETHRFTLPDGKQYFVIKPLDEGGKTKFQKTTNKGIRVNQRTEDAHLDVDPAGERHALILASVTSHYLVQLTPGANPALADSWTTYPESDPISKNVAKWLERANPKVVQDLELFIRTKNPWMQADMNVEEIEKEIDRLYELKKQVQERQEGEGGSATK